MMGTMNTPKRRRTAAAAILAMAAASPAHASDGTTVKLIELLVKNGVLSRTQATALLHEAQSEAGTTAHRRRAPTTVVSTTPPANPPGAAADDNGPAVHVTYVPPLVRDQIAAEVKQQVMQEAQDDGWADQYGAADWTRRVKVTGDIRLRSENAWFPRGNYGQFVNFNAINSSSNGFNQNSTVAGSNLPPVLNTTEDRYLPRIRARINVEGQVADWIDADIRIATGNDNSPVSTNQTLGQYGTFSKYSLWIDLAYLRARPTDWLTILAGRSYNPFWTSNLLFYDDLSFDGISAQISHALTRNTNGFLTVGGYPVFNNAFDFGTLNNTVTQLPSQNAWLLAAQGGVDWRIAKNYDSRLAVGFFDFLNVEGAESTPCVDPAADGACSTDGTKQPGYEQFGNTFFPIRNILSTAADNAGSPGAVPQNEYYGLASRFAVLDVHGQLRLLKYNPVNVTLGADFVDNLAFDRSAIASRMSSINGPVPSTGPANNFASSSTSAPATFDGGNTAYDVSLAVGNDDLNHFGAWNASIAYKYIATDALLDSITDPNFHLGGTNAKGYIVNANLGLARNTYISSTYYSASQVSGPNYSVDVLFVDLNARF